MLTDLLTNPLLLTVIRAILLTLVLSWWFFLGLGLVRNMKIPNRIIYTAGLFSALFAWSMGWLS